MGFFKPINPHQDFDFASSMAFCQVRETQADVEDKARKAFFAANPDLIGETDTTESEKTAT